MFSRIVLDEKTVNAAIGHFLKNNIDSPVGRIRVSGDQGALKIFLTDVKIFKLSFDFEFKLFLELEDTIIHCRAELGKTAGLIQQFISKAKIDSALLWLFPNLRELSCVRIRNIMEVDIDLSLVPFQLGSLPAMAVTDFTRLYRLMIAPSPHEMIIADFEIKPPEE